VLELPKKRKEKAKEISVSAPSYIPKKAPVFKDTTGTEALDVFKVVETISRITSVIMVIIGIFVVIFSVYNSLTAVDIFLNPLAIPILGAVGALNIFSGLLLLAKK
jgi:hypothetical protein